MSAKNKPSVGWYFEEFRKGMIIKHPLSKTIFESDNNLFCLLTMNHHPVHLNMDYADSNQHGKILVVGTLVLSLAVGITVPEISGKAIANLSYESVRHVAPVFIGDTIYVETEVLDLKESQSKSDRGIIDVESVVRNQNGEEVLRFNRKVLVKRRENV